jgi:hypothetical protein
VDLVVCLPAAVQVADPLDMEGDAHGYSASVLRRGVSLFQGRLDDITDTPSRLFVGEERVVLIEVRLESGSISWDKGLRRSRRRIGGRHGPTSC